MELLAGSVFAGKVKRVFSTRRVKIQEPRNVAEVLMGTYRVLIFFADFGKAIGNSLTVAVLIVGDTA